MKPSYVVRLDDIHPRMNRMKFVRIRDLLQRYDVHPIIGIVPDCTFSDINRADPDPRFWDEMRELQAAGWVMAIHGCHHAPNTRNAGLLRICRCSEFAGLSYDSQYDLLKYAQQLFQQNGIDTKMFMAPWHTFDGNTLNALKTLGITKVTDGYRLRPFRKFGVTFLPQQFDRPRKLPFGAWTFVFHPDALTDEGLSQLGSFLEANGRYVVTPEQALGYRLSPYLSPVDHCFSVMLMLYRYARVFLGYTPSMACCTGTGTAGADRPCLK